MDDREEFEQELEKLINYYSKDSHVGLHDFVIAKYLNQCLDNLRYIRKEQVRLSGEASLFAPLLDD